MIYDVTHKTVFSYASRVSLSQHLLHMAPRACPQQTHYHFSLIVEPAPVVNREDFDFFGNPITYLTVEEPHDRLTIIATSRVELIPVSLPIAEATIAWDQMAQTFEQRTDREAIEAHQFIFDSPYTVSQRALAYVQESFPPGRPLLQAAIELTSRIFRDFKYEGGVTDINTPVDRILTDRRGVCQDFAHLQIACLRALGLPARYVSGYLRTHPAEGQELKIGADASHAWLSVWIPAHGWVDLDPTNDMLPGDEHITVAWGRDYGDVSPITGMVLGGGAQKIDVSVDVRPV